MLVIRLFRTGKKNQPFFKIVVTDKRNPPKGGRFVEEVGSLDPQKKKHLLKKDRVEYWISKGAQPSSRVHNLLVEEGVIKGPKISLYKKPKKQESQEAKSNDAKAEEKQPSNPEMV